MRVLTLSATAGRTSFPVRVTAAIAAPIVFAAISIFWGLRTSPIWVNEAYSVNFARLSWAGLWDATRHVDAVFVLYYSLLHVVTGGHATLVSARVFSALCSLAMLPIVYLIGTRLFNRNVGILAATLCALNFLFLHEAREARMYGLLCTVECASWLAFIEMLDRRSAGRAVIYAALLALSLWLHPLAALNIGAQLFLVLVIAPERKTRLTFFGCIIVAACAALPLALIAHHAGSGQISWESTRPGIAELVKQISFASGGFVPGVVGVALVGTATFFAIRGRERNAGMVLAWLLIPAALDIFASYVLHPLFQARYLIEMVPAAAILIAWMLIRLPMGSAMFAGAFLVLTSALSLDQTYTRPLMDWPKVASTLRTEARPGDPLLIYPSGVFLTYRLARASNLIAAPQLPIAYPSTSIPVWSDYRNDRAIDYPPGHRVVWLLEQQGSYHGDDSLQRHYRKAEEVDAHLLILERYVPR